LERLAASAMLTLGVLGLAAFASSSPASAASPTPVCSGGTCTVTFSTAGTGQSWVVPAGVTSESFTLYGAIGGSGEDTVGTATFLGGDGAKVTGTLSAGAGTTLTVDVGGAGGNLDRTGGINGGGTGGDEVMAVAAELTCNVPASINSSPAVAAERVKGERTSVAAMAPTILRLVPVATPAPGE
jgi:hypothetical protein